MSRPDEALAGSFAGRVIEWQQRHGRHDLPWQNTRDPYRIWVSEIMLQQTQVATVLGYYERFLQRFADVRALAAAPLDDVLSLWSGLGYYSRARNLHRCAHCIVEQHGGAFPKDPAELAALPGIGRSTAAAIAVFAFGARAAILDGNVKRVICRVFGIEGVRGSTALERELWSRVDALLPAGRLAADTGTYTQGLMDLGATVCTPTRPRCVQCPFATDCVAVREDAIARFPAPRPRKTVPTRRTAMLVWIDDDAVWLQQRAPSGIWGGLLSFPECALDPRADSSMPESPAEQSVVAQQAATAWGIDPGRLRPLAPFVHRFTHYTLHAFPFRLIGPNGTLAADGAAEGGLREEAGQWWPLARIAQAPLPKPVKSLLLGLSGDQTRVNT